jgi:single-strand DNA-binding protein
MEFTAVLTGDATVRNTKNDKQVVAFSVVINDDYKTKSGDKKELRTFINCSYWRSVGIATYLTKGSVVTVSGRMGINAYKKADGDFNANLSFTTETIKIVASPRKTEGVATIAPTNKEKKDDNGVATDDLPF